MLASSETVMNSVTRTSVFSRSFSSRRFSSCRSRKVGPSSRRCTPLRAAGPLIEASVREMFCATASWSTSDFLPFLRFFPLSRRRSSSGPTPGAADATGRGGAGGPPPGAALATGLGRTGVGITGRGGAPNEAAEGRRRRARAHRRPLLGLAGRQVTANEDLLLLEQAEQLLGENPNLSRKIVTPRRRPSPPKSRRPGAQSRFCAPARLHRRTAEPRAQRPG